MGDFRIKGAFKMYVVFLCAMVGARGTGPGRCPKYPPLPDFDIRRMAGTWFEVERSFYLMEISTSCTQLEVAVTARGFLSLTITTVNRWIGSPSTTYGIGIPSYAGSPSFRYKLNNRMPYVLGRMLPGAGQYSVLFTDYEQYAIVWSCTSVSIAHSDRIWVIARRREIAAGLRAQIYGVMEQLRLDPDRLILANNHNCTHEANT
ncbi:hypothetical protein JYU34_007090 [Plutella xylostella]|uniref:Apolipoprotein D n=1 Tax=Plutella xylostella TaxID=51655 RepID=A0ABQ7QPL9_PLUXY|nr:hypothetical protein JYU34_007090 [Plutella xylostella]